MPLSIIIVNYRSASQIVDCINSAIAFGNATQFEWIVVDNQSNDNSREVILAKFPFIHWIEMGYNAGFARANNEGIRQSKGEVVLLLNPDTLVLDNAIEHCYRQFINDPYVACGVQLLNHDHTPQISGSYFMKGGLNYLLPLPYIGALIKWLGNTVKVKKPHVPDAKTVVEVDWINGAFLMAKKAAIDKAGLLDEDFFLYAEEIEWCSRLKKTGRLCLYGQYHVVHLQGETANQTFGSSGKGYYNLYDRKGLQIMLSNFVRIRKQFGKAWFLFQLLVYTFAVPVLFIGSFLENLFRLKNPFSFWMQAGRFTKNLGKVWQLTPVILSNKPYFYKVL